MNQKSDQPQSGTGQPIPPQPQPPQNPVPPQAPQPPLQPPPVVQARGSSQQSPPYSGLPPKGDSKVGLIIGIVAGVLVLGGIIFALVIFFIPTDDSDEINDTDKAEDSQTSATDEGEGNGLNKAAPLTFSPLGATEEAALTAILNSSYDECDSEADVVISKYRENFSIQTCSTEFVEPGEFQWHTNLIMQISRGSNKEELLEVQSTWHCGSGEINEVTAILGDKFIIAVRNYFTDATYNITNDARKKILNEQTKLEYERLKTAGLEATLINVCDLI